MQTPINKSVGSDSDSECLSSFSRKRKRAVIDDSFEGTSIVNESDDDEPNTSTDVHAPSTPGSLVFSTPPSFGSKSTPSVKSELSTPPGGVKKVKIEKPLPDPYELPCNFRPDVELALSNKHMTKETTKAFISRVASHMFTFKKYPTQDEYVLVARAIIQKITFLRISNRTPHCM